MSSRYPLWKYSLSIDSVGTSSSFGNRCIASDDVCGLVKKWYLLLKIASGISGSVVVVDSGKLSSTVYGSCLMEVLLMA